MYLFYKFTLSLLHFSVVPSTMYICFTRIDIKVYDYGSLAEVIII